MKKSIFALAFGAFAIISTEFGIIGMLPILAQRFNVSIDTAGWLVGGFALVIAMSGPFLTLATQKINRKTILVFTLLLFVVGNILAVYSTSFSMLMIARILPAFLHPVFWAVAFSVAVREAPEGQVSRSVAFIMNGLNVATVISVPIGTYCANLLGWQSTFWLNGLLNLLALLSILWLVPSIQGQTSPVLSQIKTIVRTPIVWNSLFGALFMFAGLFASYSYLAEYLQKVPLMTGQQISIVMFVFGTFGLIGNWLAGKYMQVNPNKTIAAALLALMIAYVLFIFFGSIFAICLILLLLWGMLHTMGMSVVTVRANLAAPVEVVQLANGLHVSFLNLGITIGSAVGGLFIDHFGILHIMIVGVVFFIVDLILYSLYFGKKWWVR
jgi:predicted MFS family arabinose efflux permease